MYRGSRKHVLDWTAQAGFAKELKALFPSINVEISVGAMWMPRGHGAPVEARLENFGPVWMPSNIWENLKNWWLLHKKVPTLLTGILP